MVKIAEISQEDFEKEQASAARKGQWTQLLTDMKADGKPRKVTDLTRGQVAALYRRARDEGFQVRTSYKEGYVVLAKPAEKSE